MDRTPARSALVMPTGLCVGEHVPTGRGRLGDGDAELLHGQLRVARVVAGREHPAGRADLHRVGPGAQDPADHAAHLVRAVGEPARPAGVRHRDRDVVPGREPAVAVATGLADDADRDQQPGPVDQPVLDGLTQSRVRAARVARGRDPGGQRPAGVPGGGVELVAERPVQAGEQVDPGRGEVHVAVEEPRGDRLPGHVEADVPVQPGPDVDDDPTGDDDVRGRGVGAGALEDPTAVQERAGGHGPVGVGSGAHAAATASRSRDRTASWAWSSAPIGRTSSVNAARGLWLVGAVRWSPVVVAPRNR